MMVHLCPTGSEGASYAMFTTVNNCASGLAGTFSTLLLGIWDVSKETMLSGDLSGMTKLTIFTTILQTSGLLFVKLLPNTKDDLKNYIVEHIQAAGLEAQYSYSSPFLQWSLRS